MAKVPGWRLGGIARFQVSVHGLPELIVGGPAQAAAVPGPVVLPGWV